MHRGTVSPRPRVPRRRVSRFAARPSRHACSSHPRRRVSRFAAGIVAVRGWSMPRAADRFPPDHWMPASAGMTGLGVAVLLCSGSAVAQTARYTRGGGVQGRGGIVAVRGWLLPRAADRFPPERWMPAFAGMTGWGCGEFWTQRWVSAFAGMTGMGLRSVLAAAVRSRRVRQAGGRHAGVACSRRST